MKSPYEPPKSELSDIEESDHSSDEKSTFRFPNKGNNFPALLIVLALLASMYYLMSL